MKYKMFKHLQFSDEETTDRLAQYVLKDEKKMKKLLKRSEQKYAQMKEYPSGESESEIYSETYIVAKRVSVWRWIMSFSLTACALLAIGVGSMYLIANMNPEITPGTVIEESSNSMSENNTMTEPQNIIESPSEYSVEVGDGIYRVSSIPTWEDVTLSCEYGTAYRSEGATAQAFGQTLDFSSIPDEYNNDFLIYCVREDLSTVYFADYLKFYQSGIDLESPTLLFTMGYEQDELPSIITELITFTNTDLLFFRGATRNGNCVGSIDPKTGKADFISCTYSMKTVLCNNGVMLCDYRQNDTALYWECGNIYEIKLCDPNEGELGAYVSANGKYICTFLWGKAEDNSLIERYSVYDTKSGEFIKSFDWTFQKKVGEHLPKGFTFYNIDEKTQSVYLKNTEDNELYQFYFGE